jgi:hypothetical protein
MMAGTFYRAWLKVFTLPVSVHIKFGGDSMANDVKMMDIKEFREMGLLAEVNRTFFYPLGLALEITVEDDGTERLTGKVSFTQRKLSLPRKLKKLRNSSRKSMKSDSKHWVLYIKTLITRSNKV